MRGALALVLAVAVPAVAQVRPTPSSGDPRLQTVRYDPDQVVTLSVAEGYQLMVAFDRGERVETIALGNSTSWQASANKRGDALFVKNLSAAAPTNMTVVTDARTYAFDLTPAVSFGDAPYIVRFSFAEPVNPQLASDPAAPIYRYKMAGAKALRPSAVDSDRTGITISWPTSAALPAVFRTDDDGQETLVNGEMRDGVFVLPGHPAQLVFRLDRLTATATRVIVRERHTVRQ